MCATLCTKKQKGHIRADGPCMSLLTWYEVIALIMVWLSLSLLTHTEKFVFVFFFFGPELQENWLFDFVSHGSETSVRPATSEASLLSDDVVLKWAGTLDNLCFCVHVCVFVMHSTSLSWSRFSSFPLPTFFLCSNIFQSCIPLPCLYLTRERPAIKGCHIPQLVILFGKQPLYLLNNNSFWF